MNISGSNAGQSFDQFIKLMVSQIQYQDPLDPVSQESTTAQLAQISTVSGIEKLNLQFGELLQLKTLFDGVQLVGEHVEYKSPTTGLQDTGQITEARVNGGQLDLSINGETVHLSDIVAVVATEQAA